MTLRTRLAKIEQRRRSDRSNLDDPNRPKHISEILGGPYDPSITLAKLLYASAELPSIPPHDDPDYVPENVVDVDSYILKLQGDREGWRARQRGLKRDVAEMIRREWPDIDAEPPREAGEQKATVRGADGA